MARYTGPVCRICRREGSKLYLKGERCLTDRCAFERKGYAPGQHGQRRPGDEEGLGPIETRIEAFTGARWLDVVVTHRLQADPATHRGPDQHRPSGAEGVHHYHDTQDELYFVHSGTARVEVGGEERILGPGGLFHVESTTPRRIESVGDEELVMLVVGGKGGYVERDGHVMSDEDLEIRQGLSNKEGS